MVENAPIPGALSAGELVRQARQRKSLTQDELAAEVGSTRTSVQNWEAGQPPRAAARRRLAEVLGLDLAKMNALWDEPGVANVISLDAASVVTSSSQIAGTASTKERLLEILLAGLDSERACNPTWVAAAAATARLLDVPWTPDL